MQDQQEFTIKSEKEAFALIKKALENEISDTPLEIKFDGWPILEIKLQGKGYESTITSDMAQALVELQHAMNRAYARSVHHTANARKLTDIERQEILFKAKVEQGSSLIKVDIGDFAEKIALKVVGKMTAKDVVIMILGVAITAGSVISYKSYLQTQSDDKKISVEAEKAISLNKEETARMEILASVMKTNPALNHIREDFDEARHKIVHGTADAKSISVNGVTLDRESARTITKSKRSLSKEIQLNGNYLIKKADFQIDGEVRLTVTHIDTLRVFNASFRDDSLDKEQTKLIQDAEWERKEVFLSINAAELRGDITTATIISVKSQPSKKITKS